MKNRLRMHWRVVLGFYIFFLWMALPAGIAQPGLFEFNYPGPTSIPVIPLPSCSNILAGNMGTPTVISKDGGTITLSAFDPVLSGFQLTDPWNFGEVAHVFWQVADNHGHTAVFDFFVTFVDTTKPVLNTGSLPPTVVYASISQVPLPPTLTATDSCSTSVNIAYVQTTPPPLCQAGSFTRTWTATDQSGNSDVFTQTIVILQDNTAPTVLTPPQNGSASCTQTTTAYPAWLAAQMVNFKATDPSGIASYTNNAPPMITGSCPAPLTVTFQATDSCGFSVTRTATYTVIDNNGPYAVRAPQDSISACSPPAGKHLADLGNWIHRRAGLIAKDSCSPDALLTYSMQVANAPADSAQVVAAFLASFALGCSTQQVGDQQYDKVRGIVRVDFYATDACGKSSNLGRGEFGVIDTVAPVVSGSEIVEECGGGNDATALTNWINAHGNATVSDDCSAYTWTNFSWITSTGQTGNGVFNTGPFPAIPANTCNWFVDVTFRATDDCGNTGAGVIRFRITDTTKPVFSGLPPLDTLFCPNTTPPLPTAYVSDNCDAAVAIISNFQIINPVCSDSYSMLVTWIATDDCGNTRTATQTFLVRDTTKPVITLAPASFTARCDTFVLPPAPVLGQSFQATDVCGDIVDLEFVDVSNQNPDPATCAHYTYSIVRTFTVTDDCGNSRTAQQIIQVVDNIPPDFSGFTDTTLICAVPEPLTPAPTASDICSGIATTPAVFSDVVTGGLCNDSYVRTLTWASTDVCGNTGYFEQNITIADTVKPTLTGVPGDISVECNAIPQPPAPGVVSGADNCDEAVDIVFLETEIRDPNPANCAHWTNYIVRREWTVTDNCGNSRIYTQSIMVQDNTGPEVVALDTVKTPTAPGLCGTNTVVPSLLSVFDDCTSQSGNITLRDTVVLTPSGTPIDQVPANPVVFSWSSPNMPPDIPVVGTGLLAVALDNADSELASETFEIFGEDGYKIGRTKRTNAPCGFSGDTTFTIPASLLNAWLTDGQLNITLTPNSSGTAACNAYCLGGRARATLTYTIATQQIPVTVQVSIDNGPLLAYPPSGSVFLEAGDHIVEYVASDCAGNSSTASTVVRIEDLEPPTVIAPPPITAYVGVADCIAGIALPFPDLSENCGFSADLSQSTAVTPVPFEVDDNAGLVPKNMTLSISGVLPNAVSGGVLKISHLGDNAQPGEFFKVLDEQNMFLGATTLAQLTDECSAVHETTIQVSAAQINTWAADGVAQFKLHANRDVVNFINFIDTCGTLVNGFDGVSTVQAMLTYNYAVVDYFVKKGTTTVLSGQLTGDQTLVNLPPGNYTVTYRVKDSSGGEGNASFPLVVRDTIDPVAKCKPITIFTNPSGSINYNLTPPEINNGSSDNCSGAMLTFQLSQSVFTCNMASPPSPGNVYPITLTVTDTSGNSASCSTTVQVKTVIFLPSVTPGVCEGGDVQLIANPPAPNPPYTYKWNGPNGFISFAENPYIPNASSINEGTYVVTVTGPTTCESVGSVLLDLANLPTQPAFQNVPDLICEGANLNLQCQVFGGTNVMYSWFAGTPANPTLLGTTTIPMFTVLNPLPGIHQYYVKVAADGCTSLPSAVKEINVQARPVATVLQPVISVCTCEPISLGTSIQQMPGITYLWNGPGWGPNTAQNPTVTSCAQNNNAGVYTLVISQNGCPSAPATATVTVRQKPPQPAISGASIICEGDTILLVCNNVATAAEYHWISPLNIQTTTTTNSLVISSASLTAHSGEWRLQVVMDNCLSDLSDAKPVQVQAYPNVTASSNSPVCQGNTLNLNAISNSPPPLTFSWTGPNGFFMNGPNPSLTAPVSGAYVVTVSAGSSCTNTAVVNVTVITPPVITSATNTAPVCSDCATDAVLQATIFTENGPLTYAWTGPDTFASSLPSPVIPKVCADDNGTYNLIVYDAYGCTSNQASTEINMQPQPKRPELTPSQLINLCAGAAFSISVQNISDYGSNVIFEWHTPNGIISQPQSKLMYAITGPQHSGDYWLVVKAGDCASAASDPVQVIVNAIPAAPVASSNSPVCEGAPLQLMASTIPGATYTWVGTSSGFTAAAQNPTIPQASEVNEECYTVTATVAGCTSPAGEVCTTVKARPNMPKILPVAPLCLDDPAAQLTLKINPNNQPFPSPGAQYVWYDEATQTPLGPASFALTFVLNNLSGYTDANYNFYVQATLDGCVSLPSPPVTVDFDAVPSTLASAGPNFPACDSFSFDLTGNQPPAGIDGLWRKIGGPAVTIVAPSQFDSEVKNAAAGNTYTFEWAFSKGACKNYSRDTVEVAVSKFETPEVCKSLIVTCSPDSVPLCAIQGQTTNGYWTQPLGQTLQNPPVIIDDIYDPNTLVHNLIPVATNDYRFYWTFDIAGCGTSSIEVIVHPVKGLTDAGQDKSECNADGCTLLAGSAIDTFETGKWTSLNNPDAKIITPNSPGTRVCDLQFGENIFVWETNGGLCADRSRDTVLINYALAPLANEDSLHVAFGQKVTINALLNDVVPPQFEIEILEGPFNGKLEEPTKGTFTYLPNLTFSGTDELTYRLCNLNPDCACSITSIKFIVDEAGECRIPTVFTPNNDGVNDIFVIPDICLKNGDGPVDNEVTIFNQWGDQVFHAQPYENNWDGTFNGEPLPAGTYFFVVKWPVEPTPRTGFLQIQR